MATSSIKQAFVLGAGLGTRLRPLTSDLPKPLIPIFQKPLITFALDHLIHAGVKSFVINTHKFPELFEQCFEHGNYAGHPVRLINEPDLLETGGGIKNAEPLLGTEPFITYSGDILSDVDLRLLIEEHFRRRNDVTLALRETGLASGVALREGRVVDIAGKRGIAGNYDFANIAVWNPDIFRRIPSDKKISFVPILVDWIGENAKIGGVVLNDGGWFNIGSRAEYLAVHRTIWADQWRPSYLKGSDWPRQVDENSKIASTAKLLGFAAVGANCRIGDEAILEDTILWPGAQIASRSRLSRCIVRSHQNAAGIHHDVDI
jgi:NDP-sugar pyrophosphorylase family protein